MDGGADGRMHLIIEGCMHGRKDGWMHAWTDDGKDDGWMHAWTTAGDITA